MADSHHNRVSYRSRASLLYEVPRIRIIQYGIAAVGYSATVVIL
jgi:hypothetical protein